MQKPRLIFHWLKGFGLNPIANGGLIIDCMMV
jgi:hypothetical protein